MEAIRSFNDLYVSMCESFIEQSKMTSIHEKIQTFEKYNHIMFKIVPF